jgi:hypothetical protein
MRGFAILVVTLLMLSAIASPHRPHFTPYATGPLPAVNVP